MGQIIKVDNQNGDLPDLLTETGTGGVISAGYLEDAAATTHLEAGETPVFVLTNRKRGIEHTENGETSRYTPGDGYRTIVVLTDTRVVTAVGGTPHPHIDGDAVRSIPLVEIDRVDHEGGRRVSELMLSHGDGTTTIYTGGNTDEVVAYLRDVSQTWIHVENVLEDVRRYLVDTTDHRTAGNYDAAMGTARKAAETLADSRETATTCRDNWGITSPVERVEAVKQRLVETLAEVRTGRARAIADAAEDHWRSHEYERAHDKYEEARSEYEAVRNYAVDTAEASVREEQERLERILDRLEATPLRRARAAHRTAADADDPATAAAAWETAMERYRTALELDWGAPERRFDGDPPAIREQLETAVKNAITARRKAAADAKGAGDWYLGADQFDLAIEEFETALAQYEQALTVARDRYPNAVDHLTVERDAIETRIERARERKGSESVDPVETTEPDQPTDISKPAAGEDGERETPAEPATLAERLRTLPETEFQRVIGSVLTATGWSVSEPAGEASPSALVATKETPAEERMYVALAHRQKGTPLDQQAIEAVVPAREELPDADSVMVATATSVTPEATRHARRRQVRLLDDETITAVIEAHDIDVAIQAETIEATS
jgi:tetratricopeptide (TPR) repeat protein